MLVRDRPRLTKQALESLASSQADIHAVIVDDRSEDETFEIVKHWSLSNGAHLTVNDYPSGTGELRNFSVDSAEVKHGRGDYLYLSDNDVFFKPGWLDVLIKCYEEAWWKHGYRVLGAYNHPFHHAIDKFPVFPWDVCSVNALATQSMLMRWEVWDKYGPFCKTPVDRVCMSEDVDFCNRITKDGYKVGVVSPSLIVSTGITNTFGEKIPGWELVKAQCPEGVICE